MSTTTPESTPCTKCFVNYWISFFFHICWLKREGPSALNFHPIGLVQCTCGFAFNMFPQEPSVLQVNMTFVSKRVGDETYKSSSSLLAQWPLAIVSLLFWLSGHWRELHACWGERILHFDSAVFVLWGFNSLCIFPENAIVSGTFVVYIWKFVAHSCCCV